MDAMAHTKPVENRNGRDLRKKPQSLIRKTGIVNINAILYHFDQFAAGLEILKIYEPRSGIGCEKRGQTLFFDPSVTRDRRIE